ncbi:MAG: succinylglutamate desuccinylase/aspartoacylase family protein, partial [Actinomycetota bacterium]
PSSSADSTVSSARSSGSSRSGSWPTAARARRSPFELGGEQVRSGRKRRLELPIAKLVSGTQVSLPVLVLHGVAPGPTVWVSAALHGDEVGGVEIIRRVLEHLDPKELSGTLIAVPVINVYGFNTGDRYLPDRRDLNRSFPGSPRGSLAGRIANLLMTEVVSRCSIGIDLHTGSDNRVNLPQVRGDLDDAATVELARVFGAPLALHSRLRDGSLRQAATDEGATVLLFEGGEALRFDQEAIRVGVGGVLRVLHHVGVTDEVTPPGDQPVVSPKSHWVRATRSGIAGLDVELGDVVAKGDTVATVHDPFGKRLGRVNARRSGMVIGHTQLPLVNRGDALVHVADLPD